jgi:glutaredoxin
MKVELLVSDWCAPCHQAERIWRQVAAERDFEFAVLDLAQPEGKALAQRLRIRTIPALVIDGRLAGVGVQSLEEARRLVAAAPPRRGGGHLKHIGLGLEPSSRVAVLSALAYLLIAGAFLAARGTLFVDGPVRPAAIHVFTLGFLVFLVYGLGEHMLPRFTGRPIRLGALAWTQLALAHAGVWLFAGGIWLGVRSAALAGMGLAWAALLVFTVRLWPVLWPHTRREPEQRP